MITLAPGCTQAGEITLRPDPRRTTRVAGAARAVSILFVQLLRGSLRRRLMFGDQQDGVGKFSGYGALPRRSDSIL
jgi:hypothetical protein